jgi:hypothetical protein
MLAMAGVAGAVPLVTGAALGRQDADEKRAPEKPLDPGEQFELYTCWVYIGRKVPAIWVEPQLVQTKDKTYFTAPKRLAPNLAVPNPYTEIKDVPICYMSDGAKDPMLMFSLPWAPSVVFTCLAKTKDGPLSRHIFTIREGPGKTDHTKGHLHVSMEAQYGKVKDYRGVAPGDMCCYTCGENEVCIPAGHTCNCNGVELTCKP